MKGILGRFAAIRDTLFWGSEKLIEFLAVFGGYST